MYKRVYIRVHTREQADPHPLDSGSCGKWTEEKGQYGRGRSPVVAADSPSGVTKRRGTQKGREKGTGGRSPESSSTWIGRDGRRKQERRPGDTGQEVTGVQRDRGGDTSGPTHDPPRGPTRPGGLTWENRVETRSLPQPVAEGRRLPPVFVTPRTPQTWWSSNYCWSHARGEDSPVYPSSRMLSRTQSHRCQLPPTAHRQTRKVGDRGRGTPRGTTSLRRSE